MKNTVIAVVVAVVVAGGAGYWFGNSHAQASMSAERSQRFAQLGQAGGGALGAGNRGGFGGGVNGDVLSVDANGFTVKMQDGGSRVVIVPASVAITKSASGSLGDLIIGRRVTVFGPANSDGSITAQSVMMR